MKNYISLLRNFQTCAFSQMRTCSSSSSSSSEGIQYHGFVYYPRHKDFKDPPYQPHKLFLIKRIKPVKGTNPEERKSLEELDIDGHKRDNGHINIVKNEPETNRKLWQVKHLVDIKPITWKGELPKDGDYSGTILKSDGELVMMPRLKPSSAVLKSTKEYLEPNKNLTISYMKKYLLAKWVNGFNGGV